MQWGRGEVISLPLIHFKMQDRTFYQPKFVYPPVIDMSQYVCWSAVTMSQPSDEIGPVQRQPLWSSSNVTSTGYVRPSEIVQKPISYYVNAATNVAPMATQIGFDMAGSGLDLVTRDTGADIQIDFAQIALEGVNALKAYVIYLLEWDQALNEAADNANRCYDGAYQSEFRYLIATSTPPWKTQEKRDEYKKPPPQGHCNLTGETSTLALANYAQMKQSIVGAIASAQNYIDVLNAFTESMIDQVETLLYLENVYQQYLILEAENISFENQIKATQFSQNISQLAVVGSIGFILADQAKLIK